MTDIDDLPAFQVVNTRVLAFAPGRVRDAFADPEQLAVWWGPDGFSNRVDALDLRVGGAFHITMINETGKAFENVKIFTHVAPDRIVFDHIQPVHDFAMTMLFEPEDGGTRLTWIMDFAPGQNSDMLPFLEGANEQNFDRLQAFLEQNP